jgi:hypothetical protein
LIVLPDLRRSNREGCLAARILTECPKADIADRQQRVDKRPLPTPSPVFELNVWNREANQALPGQFETLEWAKLRQESGHS